MEKEFVPYELALRMKQLGFDEPCVIIYYNDGKNYVISETLMTNNELSTHDEITSPFYQQTFRWFREKYNLWNMIYPRDGWNYSINRVDETTSCSGESFHSVEINEYEEAELECLKKLIEIVKNK